MFSQYLRHLRVQDSRYGRNRPIGARPGPPGMLSYDIETFDIDTNFEHANEPEMFKVSRKAYRAEALEQAIASVRSGKMNATKAADEFGVPRQTFSDKIDKRHTKKFGAKTKFLEADEIVLAGYITYMASIGHPLNVGEILCSNHIGQFSVAG